MGFVSRDEQASRNFKLAPQRDEPRVSSFQGEPAALLLLVGVALAIRVYLSLTSYCISGDGVAYLAMARHFHDGDWRAALGSVYSPLYPALIWLMHRCVADWEIAGSLISVILGTAVVATTYLMTREAFGSREIAFWAAVLIALHPAIAAYSASVRTEAGYIFLTTGACWLLLKALNEQRVRWAASAGMAAGLGYLYRTEAVGFLVLGVGLFGAAGWSWKELSGRWVLMAGCAFAAIFIAIAAPYVAYLRMASGYWTIGRELNVAMMYGMGDVARNGGDWRQLGWSANASPLRAIFSDPQLYAEKVAQDMIVSIYSFAQALDPLLTLMLAIGIWARGPALRVRTRTLLKNASQPVYRLVASFPITRKPTLSARKTGRPESASCISSISRSEAQPVSRSPVSIGEKCACDGLINKEGRRLSAAFLATIVLFYFCAFALSYTGTRFMVHLIPFTLGWVAAGIIYVSEKTAQWCKPAGHRIGRAVVPAAIGITLLPRTLWPLGYDMRGIRYAGAGIAQLKKGPAAVAARDGRVAYYAGARLIELPPLPPKDFCGWLRAEGGNFLLIGNHDERLFNVAQNQRCLKLVKRYPRYGSGYYDLYALRTADQAQDSGGSKAEIATP
jgi:hypothetical protein